MSCLTPHCTGTANHTLRCAGCNANLVTYNALGWPLPWQEDPPRRWRPGERWVDRVDESKEGIGHVRVEALT